MEAIETVIPDNEGNLLMVALNFYDDKAKIDTFQIPPEFNELIIADISISKMYIDKPLHIRAFNRMCNWLFEQFMIFPNSVFSFICSTDDLETHHPSVSSETYRWRLFEFFFQRNLNKLYRLGIESKDIEVGPQGFQTHARVFYYSKQAPIIHLVTQHLENKYKI